MEQNYVFIIYIIIWFFTAIASTSAKRAIKAQYPEIHEKISAPSISEHNIKVSLNFMRFSLLSKMWSIIDSKKLRTLLHVHRALFISMILMLAYLAYSITPQSSIG